MNRSRLSRSSAASAISHFENSAREILFLAVSRCFSLCPLSEVNRGFLDLIKAVLFLLKRRLDRLGWGKSPKRTFATKKGKTSIGFDNPRVAWTYDSLAFRSVLIRGPAPGAEAQGYFEWPSDLCGRVTVSRLEVRLSAVRERSCNAPWT